jgi:uncharacterized protein (DUF1697 family)
MTQAKIVLLRGINLGSRNRVSIDADVARRLRGLVVEPEQLVISGREIYAWHPAAVARSKLWTQLAGRALGVTATARNWTTVTSLLALAD